MDAHQIRGIIITQIQYAWPNILRTVVKKDGSVFAASMGWVRKFVEEEMNWSLRQATRVSQKVPSNANEKIQSSLLWQAHSIRQYGIPISLHINSDQTQVIYQQNAISTYEKKGSHQISTVGHEEKCTFTLNMAISTSGTHLPFQAIFQGKTSANVPVASSLGYDDVVSQR